MGSFRIHHSVDSEFTMIPNQFIDHRMSETNGEFIKVYLYLLRKSKDFSYCPEISDIADALHCSEEEVTQALHFLAKEGLISWNDEAVRETPSQPPDAYFTADHLRELMQKDDVHELLFIAEQYLGKTLTYTETTKLLYFYEELHMSVDLISYLIEYCVSQGSKSTYYMEKVASVWQKNRIHSVNDAKIFSSSRSSDYSFVRKAFGITGRDLIGSEKSMVDRWAKDFSFSKELIQEACARAVLHTGSPSFAYADKILTDWHEHHIHTYSEVLALDSKYKKDHLHRMHGAGASTKKQQVRKQHAADSSKRGYDFSGLEKAAFQEVKVENGSD